MTLPEPTQGGSENGGPPVLNLGKTTVLSTPLDANLASALAYLPLGPLAIVAGFLLLNSPSESGQFNRYHAVQSLVFGGAFFGVLMLAGIISSMLAVIPFIGPLLVMPFALLSSLVSLAYFGCGLKLAFDTYNGKTYQLPYLGKYVDGFVRGK